jgi:DNA-binding NarL/FixJ family response regulator
MTVVQQCRIFLVDDHPLILSGIKFLIDTQNDMEVVGTATTAEHALELIPKAKPTVVVVDGSLPKLSGIAMVALLRKKLPQVLTLALTLHEEGPYVREFLKAGANGFVLKRSAAEDLIHAIRAVINGGTYIDPSVASKIFIRPEPEAHNGGTLSEREETVVRLVAEGLSNKEVSRLLAISVKTVETYKARACEKLGVTNRAALVGHALSEGWLTPTSRPSQYTQPLSRIRSNHRDSDATFGIRGC